MRRSIFSLLLLLPLCGAGHAVPAADSLPLHPPAPAIAPAMIAFCPPCGRTGSSGFRSTDAAIPAATDGGA